MIYGNSVGGIGIERTYVLTDETGAEYPATYVDYETTFDATENDIRAGKYAATDMGIVKGTKEIPSYHTTEGQTIILPGNAVKIPGILRCDYTKLQALICAFNTSLTNSVATEKVSIDNKVYNVSSTEELATVSVDKDNLTIDLGITNEGTSLCLIRFFTYKEEY